MSDVASIVTALRDGKLAVLPTDTVYGLACDASREGPAADLYRLKGRDAIQPTAVLFARVDALLEWIPEIDGLAAAVVRILLPGPFTLVVPNPAGRFSWLTVGRPDTIGVRVPVLPRPTDEIVAHLGAIVATSANLPGGPDPRRLDDVPAHIRDGVAAVVDGGDLPGVPSTVVDLTGPEPVILRLGSVDPTITLAEVSAAHTQFLPPDDGVLTPEA